MRHRARLEPAGTTRSSTAVPVVQGEKEKAVANCHAFASARNVAVIGSSPAAPIRPRPLTRRPRQWESKITRRAHCLRQKLLPRTCMAAHLAAAGTECALFRARYAQSCTEQSSAAPTRMPSHIPRDCNFACTQQPCRPCCLQAGRRPARFAGLRHVLFLSPDNRFGVPTITSRPTPQIALLSAFLSGFCQRLLASAQSPGEI